MQPIRTPILVIPLISMPQWPRIKWLIKLITRTKSEWLISFEMPKVRCIHSLTCVRYSRIVFEWSHPGGIAKSQSDISSVYSHTVNKQLSYVDTITNDIFPFRWVPCACRLCVCVQVREHKIWIRIMKMCEEISSSGVANRATESMKTEWINAAAFVSCQDA